MSNPQTFDWQRDVDHDERRYRCEHCRDVGRVPMPYVAGQPAQFRTCPVCAGMCVENTRGREAN